MYLILNGLCFFNIIINSIITLSRFTNEIFYIKTFNQPIYTVCLLVADSFVKLSIAFFGTRAISHSTKLSHLGQKS
jgi:hypothetical protein